MDTFLICVKSMSPVATKKSEGAYSPVDMPYKYACLRMCVFVFLWAMLPESNRMNKRMMRCENGKFSG